MLHAAGHEGTCRVAGLLLVSDGSFGTKNQGWHGVYGKPALTCTMHVLSVYLHVLIILGDEELSCSDFKIHIIFYNSDLKIHAKYTQIHNGTL